MERAALRDHANFLQKHLIKGLTAGAMKG
jgi:hypothetical protein